MSFRSHEPRSQVGVQNSAPADRISYRGAVTAKVLFVDDEAPNLVVFEAVCGEDFPVLTAATGEDALGLMRKHEVGVILSDQRMPGMTGIELLEKVQEDYPNTIRLLITAYSDLQAAEDAINRGHVRRYLRKPWEPEALKAELRDALDMYNLGARTKFLERRLLETERAYSLGVAAASVADEIRSPVEWVGKHLMTSETSISTVASILGETLPDLTRARGLLTQVEASISDARMGMRRVMELVDAMAQPPDADDIEVIELAEVVRLTMRMAERSGLRGRVLIELQQHASPRVRASRTRLSQITLNLLANAIHSAGEHQGGQGVVRVSTEVQDGWAVLEVSDNGEGVRASDFPRLFSAHNSPLSAAGGIGLAISKKIATQLGGELIATRLDPGLRFQLKLKRV